MDSISIREAADRLGVSHKVIRRLISQGTLEAHKHPGAHGVEWRVDVASLNAYENGLPTQRHPASSRVRLASPQSQPAHIDEHPSVAPARGEGPFLQAHIVRLTELLACALQGRPTEAPPVAPTPGKPCECAREVTLALQSVLRSCQRDGIATMEMCSVKALYGKPVLWRVVAQDREDVCALIDAILSPSAEWSPPGEEVAFIWACAPEGAVQWGTACGPGWFGADFEEVLRNCRVERR